MNIKISLKDQDAQNLAMGLIWNNIEFSVKYKDILCLFEIGYSEKSFKIVSRYNKEFVKAFRVLEFL